MFAQPKAGNTHWTMVTSGCAGTNCFVNCCLYINGELVGDENLEIGVFDQDGICRGAKLPVYVSRYDWWYYGITCKGYEGCEYTFRVWDHSTDTERTDLTLDIEETIVYQSLHKYGSAMDPYHLNFAMEVTGYTLDVDCYSGAKDNYYLIASPVTVNPEAVANMITPYAYDLFYFDQAGDDEGKEWITYKDEEGSTDAGFDLIPGKGYLYANAGDADNDITTVTLTFPVGNEYDGEGVVELAKVGGDFDGWNLVGNPFMETAYIDRPFYVMDQESGELVTPEDDAILPMQGLFVEASEDGEEMTFTTTDPGKTSKLSLNLVSGSKLVDRAVVNFGGGSLSKFQINSDSPKLYIPMDGEDYAVVSSAEMGEVPVSFKAVKSGSYTLAVSTEVSFNYLHLIDNLTGADQDLLAAPSYSFEASTTDYANRFRLVFATGNSDDTFAFYSNGSFVISNEGEATVQVLDVTGRMLSSEAINGSASISVDGAAGVYMIRLVNGESVKVQKVVVK